MYENSAQTKMLMTTCCLCGRPLCDAVSVERGIGPVCMERVSALIEPDIDRKAVNAKIYAASAALSSRDLKTVLSIAGEIAAMGAAKVAARIVEKCVSEAVTVFTVDGGLTVKTPYSPIFGSMMRAAGVRDARFQRTEKAWEMPFSDNNRRGLWKALGQVFNGQPIVTARGVSLIPATA